MPLSYTIDRASRLIEVVATGSLTRSDLDAYFAAVVVEGAVGFRVVFDLSAAVVHLRPADLKAFSELVQQRKSDAFDGAIALVVSSEAEKDLAACFAARTNANRPVGLFPSHHAAKRWIDSLG